MQVLDYYGSTNITKMYENDSLVLRMYRDSMRHFINELKPYVELHKDNDVLVDIFDHSYDQYLRLETQNLGSKVFDYYKNGQGLDVILNKLEDIKNEFALIYNNAKALWKKYRTGIVSFRNSFENTHNSRLSMIDQIKENLLKNEKKGILYFDTMLHDGYCTVKGEIRVKYTGEENEDVIYSGGIKHSTVCFNVGDCYNLSYAVKNKKIEYIILSVFGEGALFPLNFRYLLDGKKYVASKVEKLCGNVKNEQLILLNDTQFAEMGYNDGIAHFNDIELSRKRSEIKVYFKEL